MPPKFRNYDLQCFLLWCGHVAIFLFSLGDWIVVLDQNWKKDGTVGVHSIKFGRSKAEMKNPLNAYSYYMVEKSWFSELKVFIYEKWCFDTIFSLEYFYECFYHFFPIFFSRIWECFLFFAIFSGKSHDTKKNDHNANYSAIISEKFP